MYSYSPLRYPGGKTQLSKYIASIIEQNGLLKGSYVEPYAGGAGIAIYLLLYGYVQDIYINDIDYSIYAFWYAVKNHSQEFCETIKNTPITLETWAQQKEIQKEPDKHTIFKVGFSTFFLNRTNRSGILKGGIIGGHKQDGKYKLDCRFNKSALIQRIEKIAEHKDHIHISNMDAIEFLDNHQNDFNNHTLIYMDPPYYKKGQQLYVNYYTHGDHVQLKEYISNMKSNWIITYDDVEEIKKIYCGFNKIELTISYFAAKKRKSQEILFYSPTLNLQY